MKLLALYRPQSEFARIVEEYARDIERQQGLKMELMSVETRDGSAFASLYDIMQYPAIIVLKDDGQMQQMWAGGVMPLMNEVAGYVRA
jgi:hypothetical protein